MQKGKIQRKVGIMRWRERERERERERNGNGHKPAESSSEGTCEVIGESLVDPTDSDDLS